MGRSTTIMARKMSEIEFKEIKNSESSLLKAAFEYIAQSKSDGSFDEAKLTAVMGDKVNSHFVNPTKKEADEMLAKWKSNNIELPWDFGSWFDALESVELEFKTIEIDADGRGKIVFEQLAWPSGGIDATTELVKVFNGVVVSNNAI